MRPDFVFVNQFAYVGLSHECWPAREYRTTRYSEGYRKFGGLPDGVHRLAFIAHHGRVPDTVDHLCERRDCCNPLHMEDTTHGENAGRAARRRRSEDLCVQGHAWDEANTYLHPGTGRRKCRACRREGMRREQADL